MARAAKAAKVTKVTKAARYDVHPGVAMMQKWVAELPQKTGRTLDEWARFVKKQGPPGEKERRAWLKEQHGLGTNAAWWIAEYSEGKSTTWDADPDSYLKAAADYVEEMYAGAKAGLKPMHDELIRLARKLGSDVKVCPCKTIVPLYRTRVFAQLKPTTRTRIDFGYSLGDTPATGRLIDTGGFEKKDRITHRIPIASLADIDDEVKSWLRTAYERDAKA